MAERATISFDDDNFLFLEERAGRNRSAFINKLLRSERQRQLEYGILKANQEEAQEDYQNELYAWDVALSDGLSSDK